MTEPKEGRKDLFWCGVCEGFYGKPWTTDQRKELFHRMKMMKMNTYMYAPKDDYKHRMLWRDLYSQQEADDLRALIVAATDNRVTFVYAISPGLDITYSSEKDLEFLKEKLKQVADLGCTAFAILFDDIEDELCEADEVFDSFAYAQSDVTNKLYTYLNEPEVFLFCPTEYCTSRTVPDLARSEYLDTLGTKLNRNISILWTGPKVVPKRITVEGIKDVQKKIHRKPVIWDNVHANDYDQTRLYLGPYDGRPVELQEYLGGVLTNPNCEFEANFIAMHTLAQWSLDTVTSFWPASTEEGESLPLLKKDGKGYQPKLALKKAIVDWIPEFYKAKGSDREVPRKAECADTSGETKTKKFKESNSVDKGGRECEKGEKQRIEDLPPLDQADLQLLCDLFYLPFDHGARAIALLKTANWLVGHREVIKGHEKESKAAMPEKAREWYSMARSFHESFLDIAEVVDKFVNIPNRDLLYELYQYIGDMRSVIMLTNSYIKWLAMGQPDKEPFSGGEAEPWAHRGGLHSEFRRLLPLEGLYDTFPLDKKPDVKKVYTIRPYLPTDKADIYEVCRKAFDDAQDGSDLCPHYPDLVADRYVGALLEFCPNHCYVLEDGQSLCGYVVSADSTKNLQKLVMEKWKPMMQQKYPKPAPGSSSLQEEQLIMDFYSDPITLPPDVEDKYPSFLQMDFVAKRVDDAYTLKRLLNCALTMLNAHGSKGVHTCIDMDDVGTAAFYLRHGFEDVSNDHHIHADERLVFAKPLSVP